MSKTETTVTPVTEVIKKDVTYFDLETFEQKTGSFEVSFAPATTYQEAVQRIGSDQAELTKVLNSALRRAVISEAKSKATGGGINKLALLEMIKSLRSTPPFDAMVTTAKGEDGWKEQYAKQTRALALEVRKIPFLFNAILAKSKQMSEDDED